MLQRPATSNASDREPSLTAVLSFLGPEALTKKLTRVRAVASFLNTCNNCNPLISVQEDKCVRGTCTPWLTYVGSDTFAAVRLRTSAATSAAIGGGVSMCLFSMYFASQVRPGGRTLSARGVYAMIGVRRQDPGRPLSSRQSRAGVLLFPSSLLAFSYVAS